jgi:hypothetical protein
MDGRKSGVEEGGWAIDAPKSMLLPMLINAVKRPGFLAAYGTDVFRHTDLPRGPLTDVL